MINAEMTRDVIGAAMTVHSSLGPGLLERPYQICLAHELRKRGYAVATEVELPIHYDGVTVDVGYRIDILVNGELVVEAKAVSQILPVHRHQLLTQLKFSGHKLGLLINFHEFHLKDGLVRIANNL